MWNMLYLIPITDIANYLFQWKKDISDIHVCNDKYNHPKEYVLYKQNLEYARKRSFF